MCIVHSRLAERQRPIHPRLAVIQLKMRNLFALFFVNLIFLLDMTAQPFQISGRIIDEDLEGIPGVQILDQDSTLIATSKLDGTFELSVGTTILQFGYIGFEWEEILIPENCSFLEIIMLQAALYHFKSHRKMDRDRKKIFDSRKSLHQQAYQDGIFKSSSPCFEYKFKPDKPELDKIRAWMNKNKKVIRNEYKQLIIGDTILVPYSNSGTNSIHSAYSDYTDYDCLVTGLVLNKNRKGGGYNLLYEVLNLDNCVYEELKHNNKAIVVGDSIWHNMRFARTITPSNNGNNSAFPNSH